MIYSHTRHQLRCPGCKKLVHALTPSALQTVFTRHVRNCAAARADAVRLRQAIAEGKLKVDAAPVVKAEEAAEAAPTEPAP